MLHRVRLTADTRTAGPPSRGGPACFALLGKRFRVATDVFDVQPMVSRLFGWCRSEPRGDEPIYTLSDDPSEPVRFRLHLDGTLLFGSEDPTVAFEHLVWHVMRDAVDGGHQVVVHAGAVARNGRALLLPAPSGTGKTTLVAALVRAGFEYLSDELAVLDPLEGRIRPLPAPLSIKEGSVELLSGLVPGLSSAPRGALDGGRPVDPEEIRPGAVGNPAPVGWVIRLDGHGATETNLEPCSRATGLVALTSNVFGLRSAGRRGFEALARSVDAAACYRLQVSDLDEAVTAIQRLVDGRALSVR